MNESDRLALDWNYLEAQRCFLGCSEAGTFLDQRDVTIASCGLPIRDFNWGFLKAPIRDPAESIRRTVAYFDEPSLPFLVSLRDAHEGESADALIEAGFERIPDPVPGMHLAELPTTPVAPGELEILEVQTPAERAAMGATAFEGFSLPPERFEMMFNARFHALPHVRLYLGRVDGEPVATSCLVATGRVAGIYWVATREPFRGRGYGAALTWAAVQGGAALGCREASLQASRMGRPVYKRMGFRRVLDYVSYRPIEA